jgi:hypothetical protein
MKIYLLIYVIMSGPYTPAGSQPNVQRIEEPSINVCNEEAATVVETLRHKGCDGVKFCSVPYLVRAACVMGGEK